MLVEYTQSTNFIKICEIYQGIFSQTRWFRVLQFFEAFSTFETFKFEFCNFYRM